MSTIITGIDSETTGLDQEKGHRIIEICASMYELESRRKLVTWTKRIHPQRSIQAEAQRVHKISINDLVGCPTWEEVAPKVFAIMSKSDIVVAHNAMFDMPFIAGELIRIGMQVPNVMVFDTMTEARWATPTGKLPKLQELCFALGKEYDADKAHAAEYDTELLMECLWEGIDRGFFKLPLVNNRKTLHAA